jgi:NADH dehydrogenase FAD-containing subunit
LVLGGGAVGTELAAEIVCHFPEKQVTIVDAQKKLVPLFPSKTSDHVASWFQKKGTRLVLGEMLETIDEQGCTTKKGQRIEADVVFVCFGMKCNTQAVAKGDMVSSDRSILDQRGAVVVNECLQVPDYPNVFAVGDAMVHPSLEIKQAYYAEMNGTAAAHNVLALVNGTTLLKYPESISNASISPLVYVVSLGRYDGSLGFNGVVVNGAIAAVVKWVLEWTKVRQMESRPIGLSVWAFGDALTIWMSNHLIRPAKM